MIKKAGFIGLGLIGGSIARAMHSHCPNTELIAYDKNRENTDLAINDSVIAYAPDSFLPAVFEDCDILFLCTPVLSVAEYLPAIKSFIRPDTILTDVGSVKGEIFSLIREYSLEDNFIGGHPMAGTEKSGYANSYPGLLSGANYVLSPSDSVSPQKLSQLTSLVELLGSNVMILDEKRHDRAAAAISHLPHVLAYTLANLIRQGDDEDNALHMMAAGGLKDMTRIAASSPVMWEHICLANRENILSLLDAYLLYLKQMRDVIARGDGPSLRDSFEAAKQYRETFN